jgi:phospholipid/cholesterol/gamma-HCH transport system substrate-binding protein
MMGPASMRHVNEWVGGLVLAAIGLFVAAVLQAGVLGPLLTPALTLRVVLPPDGTGGLSAGAQVEVLGTRAGEVRRIVIDPRQQLYAEVRLSQGMDTFVRRDSSVFIRRQFGVAGAAFLEITREQGTTESIGMLIEELRAKLVPMIDDVGRITRATAVTVERIAEGEGTVGRLLADDTLARELETAAAQLDRTLAEANAVVIEVRRAVTTAGVAADSLPRLVGLAEASLANARAITADLARASPQAPRISRDVSSATAVLPGLLTQVQQASLELERLLAALRANPILGGGRGAPEPERVTAPEVRP